MWLTLKQVAERAGTQDTSILRYDIRDGRLAATKFGINYMVEEAEAERWVREEWPQHVSHRKKPVGARTRRARSRRG